MDGDSGMVLRARSCQMRSSERGSQSQPLAPQGAEPEQQEPHTKGAEGAESQTGNTEQHTPALDLARNTARDRIQRRESRGAAEKGREVTTNPPEGDERTGQEHRRDS